MPWRRASGWRRRCGRRNCGHNDTGLEGLPGTAPLPGARALFHERRAGARLIEISPVPSLDKEQRMPSPIRILLQRSVRLHVRNLALRVTGRPGAETLETEDEEEPK